MASKRRLRWLSIETRRNETCAYDSSQKRRSGAFNARTSSQNLHPQQRGGKPPLFGQHGEPDVAPCVPGGGLHGARFLLTRRCAPQASPWPAAACAIRSLADRQARREIP